MNTPVLGAVKRAGSDVTESARLIYGGVPTAPTVPGCTHRPAAAGVAGQKLAFSSGLEFATCIMVALSIAMISSPAVADRLPKNHVICLLWRQGVAPERFAPLCNWTEPSEPTPEHECSGSTGDIAKVGSGKRPLAAVPKQTTTPNPTARKPWYEALHVPAGFVWTQHQAAQREWMNSGNSVPQRLAALGLATATVVPAYVEEYLVRSALDSPYQLLAEGTAMGEATARAKLFWDQGERGEAFAAGLAAVAHGSAALANGLGMAAPVAGAFDKKIAQAGSAAGCPKTPAYVTVRKTIRLEDLPATRAGGTVGKPPRTYVTLPRDMEGVRGIEQVKEKLTLETYPNSAWKSTDTALELELRAPNKGFAIGEGTYPMGDGSPAKLGWTEGGAMDLTMPAPPTSTVTRFRLHSPGHTSPWIPGNPLE